MILYLPSFFVWKFTLHLSLYCSTCSLFDCSSMLIHRSRIDSAIHHSRIDFAIFLGGQVGLWSRYLMIEKMAEAHKDFNSFSHFIILQSSPLYIFKRILFHCWFQSSSVYHNTLHMLFFNFFSKKSGKKHINGRGWDMTDVVQWEYW